MTQRIIELLNFFDARNYSEHNRYKTSKKKVSLTQAERLLLERFENSESSILSEDEKTEYQKIFIKNILYEAINDGKSYIDFLIPFPLIDETATWVKKEGYCLCPTPIDYSHYYIDENGFFRYHEAKEPDKATNCNYRILW